MSVAARLVELREGKGLTQVQLAEASGVPQKTISNIEQGVSDNPAWKTVLALAVALGVECTAFTAEAQPAKKRKPGRPRKPAG